MQPNIKVGIITESEVCFTLQGIYTNASSLQPLEGKWSAVNFEGKLKLTNGKEVIQGSETVELCSGHPDASFCLHGVTIGVDFHWERKEDQVFKGGLYLMADQGKVIAINVLPVEEYLMSVISSEMRATSSVPLLKAHAVISRSWLLAQINKNRAIESEGGAYRSVYEDEEKRIKWYDREDHKYFDVCADDHCQRYQGITRANTVEVEAAVNETLGEVLLYDEKICDARFSKCCGGVAELFENAWEPVNHPYLQAIVDNAQPPAGFDLDLNHETSAQKWIQGSPDAFCNCANKRVLQQVLNEYDQETNDFYRWRVEYGQEELSTLITQRSGIDFGTVQELVPVERGLSGRLIQLKIVGTKKTMVIGKELEIRKILSKSHLYSSAFVVQKMEGNGETRFRLIGAGWGHGVGLCQIGAAVMGDKGYSYEQILLHYFRGATIGKLYS